MGLLARGYVGGSAVSSNDDTATVLIFWGGINTVVGNLVLGGAIEPSGGYDRPGMIGHAWLWDPLFLIWGTALAVGLAGSRQPTAAA